MMNQVTYSKQSSLIEEAGPSTPPQESPSTQGSLEGIPLEAVAATHQDAPIASRNASLLFRDLAQSNRIEHDVDISTEQQTEQEQFEEILEQIRGKGLLTYPTEENTTTPRLITKRLDGRAMISKLVEGRVAIPDQIAGANLNEIAHPILKSSASSWTMTDFSHNELAAQLGFALRDNITDVETQIAVLKNKLTTQAASAAIKVDSAVESKREVETEAEEANQVEPINIALTLATIELLGDYKNILGKGADILVKINEEVNRTTPVTEDQIEHTIRELHRAFDLVEQSLEAQKNGFHIQAQDLKNYGKALCLLIEEETKPYPSENMMSACRQSANLFASALAAEAADQVEQATWLSNQGRTLYLCTAEEALPHPRENIVQGYRESANLFASALAAHAAGQVEQAHLLKSQGLALYWCTQEEAGPFPRENIVQGYRESAALLAGALAAHIAGQVQQSNHLYQQATTLYNNTLAAA